MEKALATMDVNDLTLTLNSLGRAVQDDPIKPKLKALGTKRLKLNYDERPSSSAFKFNLRRYTWATKPTR